MKSNGEWRDYCQSGKKPADIPAAPEWQYAQTGWAGYGDWLGTGTVAPSLRLYRPFKEARKFVRSLALKSEADWRRYRKSGKMPDDIPSNPNVTYASAGWAGMGDWLGTGTVATRLRAYRPFKKARAFVRAVGLKSNVQWIDYRKSGKMPDDIPSNPNVTYASAGWVGMGDWLGTGTVSNRLRQFRPFKEARAFVHGLALKSEAHWRNYCKSGKKPDDIPSTPHVKYAETGWAGMGDWLGTDGARKKSKN